MTSTVPIPIGIITRTTANGAVLNLVRHLDQHPIAVGTPAAAWCCHPDSNAIAKFRGAITEVDGTAATFTIYGSEIEPGWPADAAPLEPGNVVFHAWLDSFEPDPNYLNLLTNPAELADQFDASADTDADAPASSQAVRG